MQIHVENDSNITVWWISKMIIYMCRHDIKSQYKLS